MKDLIVGATQNAKDKVTSLEVLEQINLFRGQEGNRAILRHDNLLSVIRDEFEDELGLLKIQETSYVHPQNGQTYPMFELTLSQARQVLVRESKFVRKSVIAYIDRLEEAVKILAPKTFPEALRMLANEVEQKELAIAQRNRAIETKAWISDKKTAKAMQTASHLTRENKKLRIEVDRSKDYATVMAVERFTKKRYRWQELRAYCNAHEIEMPKVDDKRYGTVRTYPAEAWMAVYGVDISTF